MSEHRVPMLGASWRRFEDPIRSSDPRIRSLVAALAALPAPEPTAKFRAELRAQLVAIAPRIVAESAETTAPLTRVAPATEPAPRPAAAPSRPRHTDSVFARLRRVPIARPVRIVTAVVAAFALLLGGAVWVSQNALPGDALYGLKRASEQVQLDFAGSDTAKAKDLLSFAATRYDEVRGLLSRAGVSGTGPQAGALDAHTASLITSTLGSADSDVKSASSLLAQQAVARRSPSPLTVLTQWAPSQLARLQGIAAAMPDPALRNRAESSAGVVDAAVARAQQLAPKIATGCVTDALHDSLGPLPESTCTSSSTIPGIPGVTSGVPGHGQPVSSGGVGSGQVVSVLPAGGSSANGVVPTGSQSSSSGGGGPLPSLPPITTPSLPVGVSTCGVSASLGPIGIGVGVCSGVHVSLNP